MKELFLLPEGMMFPSYQPYNSSGIKSRNDSSSKINSLSPLIGKVFLYFAIGMIYFNSETLVAMYQERQSANVLQKNERECHTY
jgi:hypothetical protein